MKLIQPDRFLQLAKKESIRLSRVEKSFKLEMLRHVVGRACIEIRNEFPYFNSLNFFAFISKEHLSNEAYSPGSIPSISEEGIDPSICMDKSLNMLSKALQLK